MPNAGRWRKNPICAPWGLIEIILLCLGNSEQGISQARKYVENLHKKEELPEATSRWDPAKIAVATARKLRGIGRVGALEFKANKFATGRFAASETLDSNRETLIGMVASGQNASR